MPLGDFTALSQAEIDEILGFVGQTVVAMHGSAMSDRELDAIAKQIAANLVIALAEGESDPGRLKDLAVEGIVRLRQLN